MSSPVAGLEGAVITAAHAGLSVRARTNYRLQHVLIDNVNPTGWPLAQYEIGIKAVPVSE